MLPESVLNKLNSLVLRKKDLEDQLSSEGATEDISKFTSLNKEYSEITFPRCSLSSLNVA